MFEDALARVSARLAEVAAQSAEQLKADRLKAANPPGTWPGTPDAAQSGDDQQADAQITDRTPKGPGREKRNASSRAQGARRQAKRDSPLNLDSAGRHQHHSMATHPARPGRVRHTHGQRTLHHATRISSGTLSDHMAPHTPHPIPTTLRSDSPRVWARCAMVTLGEMDR